MSVAGVFGIGSGIGSGIPGTGSGVPLVISEVPWTDSEILSTGSEVLGTSSLVSFTLFSEILGEMGSRLREQM